MTSLTTESWGNSTWISRDHSQEVSLTTAGAKQVERAMMELAPDVVLVLVKASPEVIARCMKECPHANTPLEVKDIKHVLARFEEECEGSALLHKITLDTSTATVEETVREFADVIEPHLTDTDRSRILTHSIWR